LASWIRECDADCFRRFLARRPDIRTLNARLEPVDMGAVHGLLVTGGPDISAEFLDQSPVDASLIREPEPERDAWEFSAILAAMDRGLPVFCICKGVQVLNVALGGTLLLDIPGHNLPEMKAANVQPLRHAAAARHRFERVNSSHHQALDRVAAPLEVEAWHAGDGVIEQVRIRDYPWGLGVQYHPERDLIYGGA
jgi:putative glutamine amidotransferase